MKARYVPQLSREQEKRLIRNIDDQCREATRQKEIDFHTLWVYALHNYSKDPWGLKRIEGLYDEVFRRFEQMKRYKEDSTDVDLPYHAMRYELMQDGIGYRNVVAYHTECIIGNASRTKKREGVVLNGNDGGFQTDLAVAAVQDHVHASVKVECNVLGTGGRWLSREIGRGSRYGDTGKLDQPMRHRVRGAANCNRIQPSRDGRGNILSLGQDYR